MDILTDYNKSRQCINLESLCHAPDVSMYFGRDGHVSACCYNRVSSFGKYPEQSIEEIWNSTTRINMRDSLKRNEFPTGCDSCGKNFYARNFSGFIAQGFDQDARPLPNTGLLARLKNFWKPEKSEQWPLRLEFELSNTCNLECAMCTGFLSSSIRANRDKLPPLPKIYDDNFVNQLLPFLPYLKKTRFFGGEPFLIDIYYKIWNHLIELNPNCIVSITTNGTVYNEKVKRILENLNCEIVVSLDSVTKSTYEVIRKNAKLEQTLSNLEALSEICRRKNISLSIAICPMVINCREMPELVSFANQMGIGVNFNTVFHPPDQSIKSLGYDVQKQLLDLYRNFNSSPRNEIESANQKALEDLCCIIESWMSSSLSRTPLQQRCADLFASQNESDAVSLLLSDLAGLNTSFDDDFSANDSEKSVDEFKAYLQAIWKVGDKLKLEGYLYDVNYDNNELLLLLDSLDNKVGLDQAHRVYIQVRTYAHDALIACGRFSASSLVEMFVSR